MFRSYYALVNGIDQDILRDGDLSCAFYVSSILKIFNLIQEVHTTVTNTVKDLEASEWKKVVEPKIGCVLVWEAKLFENEEVHTHIGFYMGNNTAISNSEKYKVPKLHHVTWNNTRKIVAIYSKELERNSSF